MTDRLAALEQFAKDMRKALELLEDDEVPSAVRTALGQLEADLSSAPALNVGCGDKEMTSSQIRDACLLGASHLRAQALQYRDGAEDAAKNPYKLDKRVVNCLAKDMKKSAEKTDASAAILARLAEHAEALSSTAPAPCPECGGKKYRNVVGRPTAVANSCDYAIEPCPRCSAQPVPSDVVVVPTNKISTLLAFIEEIRVRSIRNRNVFDVVVDVKDFNHLRALAAALRQGGGG